MDNAIVGSKKRMLITRRKPFGVLRFCVVVIGRCYFEDILYFYLSVCSGKKDEDILLISRRMSCGDATGLNPPSVAELRLFQTSCLEIAGE